MESENKAFEMAQFLLESAENKDDRARKLEAALIKARDALQLCRPEHVTRPAINAINEVLS